jgi:hypothetical protein
VGSRPLGLVAAGLGRGHARDVASQQHLAQPLSNDEWEELAAVTEG